MRLTTMRLTTIVSIAAISLYSHTWADGMNYWIGPTNNSWDTAEANWSLGYVPRADDTAVFTNDYRLIKIKSGQAASNVVFEAGSRVRFSRLDGGAQAAFGFKEINGGGKLELFSTGLQANYASSSQCPVSVESIEVISDSDKVSWFDGGATEGSRMTVNSRVSGTGKLELRGNVTIAGETTLTGSLKLDSGSVVKKLVYDNGGCNVTSDSAGTVEQVLVRGGTLAYSSSALAAATGVSVGRFALEGGTLSVASDFSGTIAVAEGGGTLFLESEWTDADSVSLPAGLSFAEGADLSKVTVQATIGESTNPAIFAIVNDNEAYSLEYVGYLFHLEELDLSWMTSGWEHPVTNKSIYSISDGSYTSLRLWNGSDWQSYSKGISVQAESHLIIKLGGNGSAFSAVVGLDRSADGDGRCGSKVVKFAVCDVVGGTNLVESAWLGTKTAAQTLTADLSGVDRIELVVYPDPDNGDGWQHCDWVNPTIVMKGAAAPATKGPNHWVGRGTDTNWDTAANWEFGVPREDATAVFDSDAEVYLGSNKSVSNLVVNAGTIVKFRTTSFWDKYPNLVVQEADGEGTIQLYQAGIKANYENRNTVEINTAVIEALEVYQDYNHHDSWLQGGDEEGKRMLVNSHMTIAGKLRVYGNTTINGDIEFDGNGNRSFALESSNGIAKNVVWNGNNPVFTDKHVGTVEKYTIIGGSCSYSTGFPAIFIDGGTVDIGDGSSIEDGGLEIGVLSGGYLRYTVSEFPAEGAPAFPANVTFPADADLAKVVAIVKNNSGDTQKAYAITKTGEAYSLAELVPTDTVKWIGGIDNNWATAGNWIYGAVPTNGQMVVFDNNASVIIGADVTADITITSGSRVSFRSSDIGGVHPSIFTTTVTGGGRVALEHVGLRAISNKNSTVDVSELEIVNCGYDSWLQGVDENNPLTVSSAIVGNGKLCVYSFVLFNGDNSKFAGNWEMGNQWGSTGRARFASGNSGFSACSSSACYGDSRIYLDTDDEVVFASLTLPSGKDRIVVTVPDATLTACAESNDIELSGNVVLQEECSLTVRKIGAGTLKTGLAGVYSLNVEQGRVEFCADNSGVSVSVLPRAEIGSSADVSVGGTFVFAPGAAIKQEYIATTTTDEQTQEETTTYSMHKLTIADDVDLANVVFGVTNPEDLPAVTKAAVAGLPRFTMFAANSLGGAVATENGGYAPEGSEKNCKWLFRTKRNSVNEVEFYPFQKLGFAVIVR